jgi:hypothetical protein
MSYFLKSGTSFKVATKESMDLHESLPVGNYTVKFDKMGGYFYLEAIDQFEIKGKVYGDTRRQSQRILNTFDDRTNSTGVMLTGEKGSGKTLLAKMLSIEAGKLGVPTIVINAPWCGDEFNAFLQMIEQPTVILFDEFEKVYDNEDQEKMLTLLDGVYPSKKLFVLTCNDKWRVNNHMRNRPGRIFYMMDYKGLEHDFIVEYCHDNLDATEHIPTICRIATLFDQFNFDMLKAMVEEMNRYDETPQQVMKMLNARPEFSGDVRYKVNLQVKGVDIPESDADSEWQGNPLTQNVSIDYKVFNMDDDAVMPSTDGSVSRDFDWECARFVGQDLKQVDSQTGKFVFMNEDGDRVSLTKVKERSYHWDAF